MRRANYRRSNRSREKSNKTKAAQSRPEGEQEKGAQVEKEGTEIEEKNVEEEAEEKEETSSLEEGAGTIAGLNVHECDDRSTNPQRNVGEDKVTSRSWAAEVSVYI